MAHEEASAPCMVPQSDQTGGSRREISKDYLGSDLLEDVNLGAASVWLVLLYEKGIIRTLSIFTGFARISLQDVSGKAVALTGYAHRSCSAGTTDLKAEQIRAYLALMALA